MPVNTLFKPSRMIAAAIVCGLITFDSSALLAQQPNPVIQLQPQVGATLNNAANQTVSRIQRQGFVPQNIQGFPQVSAEPIAPVSPVRQAPKRVVSQLKPQPAKNLPPAVVANKAAKDSLAIVNNNDSAIRTTIESPKFVNLNKPAEIKVNLVNTGKTNVGQVEFLVALPKSAKLISATPKPTMVEGQMLQFNLKTFNANEKRQILLNVVPTVRAQIDIATSVRTENQQNVLVAVREPQLQALINGPSQTNLGEQVIHEVVITNVGDGIATQVNVQPIFPRNLVQTKSPESNLIATIAPGKSAKIVYHSQAIAPGPAEIQAAVSSDDGVEARVANLAMTIFEPTLQISAIGPKINFVDRNGIYTINVENKGKVPVTDILVSLNVPEGLKITTISREANVDAEKGILRWRFKEIPAGSVEQIQMMATSKKEGDLVCSISVDSHETAEKQIKLATRVTTRANMSVALKNNSGPVQVGGKAIFAVELANDGSRQAMDINVKVELPASLRLVPNDSQKFSISGNTITFVEPQIAPGKNASFEFAAIGIEAGEHVVRTETQIEGSERRVIAEDTIFVYDIDEARVSESLKPTVIQR